MEARPIRYQRILLTGSDVTDFRLDDRNGLPKERKVLKLCRNRPNDYRFLSLTNSSFTVKELPHGLETRDYRYHELA